MAEGKLFDPTNPAGALLADMYEGEMVPALFGPWAESLVADAKVAPGERVVDIACGTGAVTRVLAGAVAPGGSVVGVDLSPAMLGVARSLELPGVELHEGDGTALPLKDADFDVAVCQQGLQFMPDKAAAVGEMARVLRPGGRVAVACWNGHEDNPMFRAIDAGIRGAGWDDAAAMMSVPFSLGRPDALQGLLEGAGFTDVRTERTERVSTWADVDGWLRSFAATPPIGLAYAGATADEQEAFIADVLARLEPYRSGQGIEVPWVATRAFATKPA